MRAPEIERPAPEIVKRRLAVGRQLEQRAPRWPLMDRLSVGSIQQCNGGRMEIIEWWPKLDSDAKAWLIGAEGF